MRKTQLHPEIFTIDNFLSKEECNAYIERAEFQKFEEAKINSGGQQVMNKMVRNNDRLLFFDNSLADKLWLRIKPYVPNRIGICNALGLNEMFRIYRYSEGQRFKMHRDGSYQRSQTESSFLSFLIYLNDDFVGGETEFRNITTVKPKPGLALLFHHPMRHEGKEIISGVKYVLRTDVMYKLSPHE